MRWRRMKPMKKTSMDAYCAIQSLFVPASLRQSVPLSAPVRHDPPPLFVSLQTEEKGAGANAPQSGEKVVLGYAQARAVAQQSRAEQSRAEQSRAEHLTQSSSAEARRTVASEKHLPQRGTLPFIRLIRLIRPIRPIPPSWAGLAASLGALRASEGSLRRAYTDTEREARRAVFSSRETRGAEGGRRDSIFFEPGGAGHFSDFELKST